MFVGIVLLSIGVGWILKDMGYLPQNLDVFWPVIFIALGISIILGSYRRKKFWSFWEKNDAEWIEIKDKDTRK